MEKWRLSTAADDSRPTRTLIIRTTELPHLPRFHSFGANPMNNKTDLAEIQNLPIAELSELLGALTGPELQDLRKLEVESNDDGGRKGALEAIDKAFALLVPDAPAVEVAAAADAELLDWQKPEYTGPLDIEQATWRRYNIKPVREVSTK